MNLKELKTGNCGRILSVGGEGALRQHLLDMGVIPGSVVQVVKYAPMGDPVEIKLHGYELTLRLAEAEKIEIESTEDVEEHPERAHIKAEHPGLGESGRFHPKGSGDPLPEGTLLTFALVGNQNSGKTTLFNQLTGSNQHVGN
ncbi:MAG: FeoA domain-containing protein, partial [Lachnospiraceae bacterium]|nr:FeoA domain-containing protein [Lachnospiraceae bacterium]